MLVALRLGTSASGILALRASAASPTLSVTWRLYISKFDFIIVRLTAVLRVSDREKATLVLISFRSICERNTARWMPCLQLRVVVYVMLEICLICNCIVRQTS
jgi:hypothetical protein